MTLDIQALTTKLHRHFKEKEHRSYPLLLNEEQIERELNSLATGERTDWILDERDGEITGILGYAADPQAMFLQTLVLASFTCERDFIERALEQLIDRYPDYTLQVGVEAENQLVVDVVKQKNLSLADESFAMSLELDGSRGRRHSDITRVDAAAWDDYRVLHEQAFGDYYWTHARIREDFQNWRIFSKKAGERIRAYAFIGCNPSTEVAEIFGLYGTALNDRVALIEHVIASVDGMQRLYYFTEDPDERNACRQLGFEIHGHYQLWERVPGPTRRQ